MADDALGDLRLLARRPSQAFDHGRRVVRHARELPGLAAGTVCYGDRDAVLVDVQADKTYRFHGWTRSRCGSTGVAYSTQATHAKRESGPTILSCRLHFWR